MKEYHSKNRIKIIANILSNSIKEMLHVLCFLINKTHKILLTLLPNITGDLPIHSLCHVCSSGLHHLSIKILRYLLGQIPYLQHTQPNLYVVARNFTPGLKVISNIFLPSGCTKSMVYHLRLFLIQILIAFSDSSPIPILHFRFTTHFASLWSHLQFPQSPEFSSGHLPIPFFW
jgi:hypothetical protein